MTELSTHEQFAPYVGETFRFEGHHVELRLASIDVRPVSDLARVPFTLIFHGPRDDILPEGMYNASATGGATAAFHIMPIHTVPPDRQEYQVVFN